nr:zinc finger, RING/FYVE/PHD-type [Tanacetum cinerariifolium]
MDKVDHISPLVELKVEVEMIEDVGFDQEEDQELEKEEADEEEDVYKDLVLHPKVTSWVDPVSGKSNHGIQVMDVTSTRHKSYELHLCPICCEPWTLDKIHQMR